MPAEPTGPSPAPSMREPGPPEPRGPRRWPWIVGIVAAFVVGLGIGILSSPGESFQSAADGGPPMTVTQTEEAAPTTTSQATSDDDTATDTTDSTTTDTTTTDTTTTEGADLSGDGYYTVGDDIQPGEYRSDGGDSCSWTLYSDSRSGGEQVVDSDTPSGSTTVTIHSSDSRFETQGCASWSRVD